jgi:hypothetical protein
MPQLRRKDRALRSASSCEQGLGSRSGLGLGLAELFGPDTTGVISVRKDISIEKKGDSTECRMDEARSRRGPNTRNADPSRIVFLPQTSSSRLQAKPNNTMDALHVK